MSEQVTKIAQCCIHDPEHLPVQTGQTEHRLKLVSQWPLHLGSRVLEIGCGQGDCTAVLASIVGPTGHVTAIDPAELSYGSPYTLGQAQAYLKNSSIGAQIYFKQIDVLDFLSENPTLTYDTAVFTHCIWYFTSPEILQNILQAVKDRVHYVCIAEYALSICCDSALPHLLSAFCQNALFLRNPTSQANIRTLLSPVAITEIAEKVGLQLVQSEIITPALNLFDGYWEVQLVEGADFLEEVHEKVKEINEKASILSMRDAMLSTSKALAQENKKPTTMNVWTAVFSTRASK